MNPQLFILTVTPSDEDASPELRYFSDEAAAVEAWNDLSLDLDDEALLVEFRAEDGEFKKHREVDRTTGEGMEPDFDDPMDGDHESALASAGLGTDEDYGYFGGGEDW